MSEVDGLSEDNPGLELSGTATGALRSNMAVHHLHAAAKVAERAHTIETANADAEHGPWFNEMLHLVPVAIIMAAAAVEVNRVTLTGCARRDRCPQVTSLLGASGCPLL